MNRNFCRITSLVMSGVIAFLSTSVFAAGEPFPGGGDSAEVISDTKTPVSSGVCGEGVSFELFGDGKLVISGRGNIADGAFTENTDIVSADIQKGVTGIGSRAFFGCSKLSSVTLPDSVEVIGESALSDNALQSIAVSSANPAFSSEQGVLFDKDKTKLVQYPAQKADVSYTVPGGVAEIAEAAFEGNKRLKSVYIPDNCKIIGILTLVQF